jgi:DNA invertase Pin-like site-specific DNA recombinase
VSNTLFGQTAKTDFDFSRHRAVQTAIGRTNLAFQEDGNLEAKKLKVASYCRVSTAEEMQLNSLENQIIHYTNYIRSNNAWNFAGIFSDRGKSGTGTRSRAGFNKMMRYALDGKINTILCKSISRFSRNVVDSLNAIRLLNQKGVKVIFEKESLDTGNVQSDFILTMLSALAQEESRNTSENITWGIIKRFEMGEPIFTRMIGYKKVDGKPWVIVEEEAKIVKEAFEACLNGDSPSQIAKKFIGKEYKKANGRTDWSAIAVRDILKNERYVGDALCQKTYTKDYLSHQAEINEGEKNQYLIQNHHQPIVDRETFYKAQQILLRNSKKIEKGSKKTYPLSGRLVCAECGGNLQRFISRGKVTWRCGNHTKSNLLCKMRGIREEDILKALVKAFEKRYRIDELGEGKRQIIRLIREVRGAETNIESQQNRLRLELKKILLEETEATIKLEDTTDITQRRIAIENKIAKSETWWATFDEDDVYRKKAIEKLEVIKNKARPMSELRKKINNIEFVRAWVTSIKAVSPYLFSIAWLDGNETEIERGDDEW